MVLGVELNGTELEVGEACAVALRDCLGNTLVALGKDIKGGEHQQPWRTLRGRQPIYKFFDSS